MQDLLALITSQNEWVVHKWLQSEERRWSRRNDAFNWCRVTAFTLCYTFLSVEVIFACNLRLPYKYLAPLYQENRSGPNSFLPFVTHNSAPRLCSQTHPWLRNSSEIHHSVPRFTNDSSTKVEPLMHQLKECKLCLLSIPNEYERVIYKWVAMKWTEIDCKVQESRKAYGTKCTSRWVANMQNP